MAPRNQPQSKPATPVVMLVTFVAAAAAILYGLPGLVLVPVGLAVAGFTHPPAPLTGRKDSQGNASPAGPAEAQALKRYRFWSTMRTAVLPGPALAPGWPPRFSFFGAVITALVVWAVLPIDLQALDGQAAQLQQYGRELNAAGAFLTLCGLDYTRRNVSYAVPSPGVDLSTVAKAWGSRRVSLLAAALAGVLAGGGLGFALVLTAPIWSPHQPVPAALLITALAVGGALLGAWASVRTQALDQHRRICDGITAWAPRWQMLKEDPAPSLMDRQELASGAVVDSFEADGSKGALHYVGLAAKIGPTLDGGKRCVVLESPDVDDEGQPMPGTRHSRRFKVASLPATWAPDVTDPATAEEDVALAAEIALALACDEGGLAPRFVFVGVERLTAFTPTDDQAKAKKSSPRLNTAVEGQVLAWDETVPEPEQDESDQGQPHPSGPQAWKLNWARPDAAGARDFRDRATGLFGQNVGAPALTDHRANHEDGLCVFGALEGVEWENQDGVDDAWVYQTSQENTWNGHWSQALSKLGPNAPQPQWPIEATERLANGIEVNRMAFVSKVGITVETLFEAEKAFPTTLAAPGFLAMTGWPAENQRAGERHAMAVALYWSASAVPNCPDDLAPVRGSSAPQWVLAGLLNQAFRAARLSRPELASATCLTAPSSRRHIWKMQVRLYGGDTLTDVRNAVRRIQQSWATEWIRLEHAQDGCIIIAGAKPSKVTLANPRRDSLYVTSLDWAQTFQDSGLAGLGGQLPALKKIEHLPKNKQVQVLDFDLSGTGLNIGRLREARTKMEANASMAYVEPRAVKNSPDRVQVYASEQHPMPEHAPYDYQEIDASSGYPFATNVEGEPVTFLPKRDIHLMVVGGSGSGKSVILQSLITGALRRGHDLYLGDPTKGAADFLFAEPYSKAVTRDLLDTLAMMKGLYAEVQRRVRVNSSHGVGSYRDLPEQVRPNHIMLVLDEFVSMISQDRVSRTASEDFEVEMDRERALAENAAKAEIGSITGKIAREARSAGVTMLLATQKLTAKDLDSIPGGSSLKVNLSRLIAGKSTQGERMSALKDFSKAPDLGEHVPPGRGIFESVAEPPIMIQTWYDQREQQALSEYVAQTRQPLEPEQKLDLAQYMPKSSGPDLDAEDDQTPEQVVDLGTVELSVDDLELDLDLDLDDEDDDEAPEPQGVARSEQSEEFDLEVLSSTAASSPTVEDPWETPQEQVRAWLVGTAVPTTPTTATALELSPVTLQRPAQAEPGSWWAAEALRDWIEAVQPGAQDLVVFADEGLDGEDPVLMASHRELAQEVLEGREQMLLGPSQPWPEELAGWEPQWALAPVEEQPAPEPDPEPVLIPAADDRFADDFDEIPKPRRRKKRAADPFAG